MLNSPLALLGAVLLLFCLGYTTFQLIVCLIGVRTPDYGRDRQRPVTILKPLCGNEPDLYANLESFCRQSHDCFQIVFGTNRDDDPALAVVARLAREFPQLDMAVSRGCSPLGANLKVANLAAMLAHARYETLVIADSDIHVPPDYLSRVVAPLADERTGMVSCLYRAQPANNLVARLAGQYIDDWLRPSVLVSRVLGNKLYAFGATLVLTRDTLAAIGGFESLADYLADDHELGARVRALGLDTVLSDCVVTTTVQETSLIDMLVHERRWWKTIRAIQPLGCIMSFVTFTLPLGLIGWLLMLGQGNWFAVVLILWALRYAVRMTNGWPGVKAAAGDVVLVMVRDFLTAFAWLWGLFGHRIVWRDKQFVLDRDGLLKAVITKDET